jgi:hypothetical protein
MKIAVGARPLICLYHSEVKARAAGLTGSGLYEPRWGGADLVRLRCSPAPLHPRPMRYRLPLQYAARPQRGHRSQRELFELFGQQAVIPLRDLGQSVVGNSEGSGLHRGEVIEAERRHLGPAELVTGQQPAVTRDYIVCAVDQNRDIEAESSDAVGDLSDLPACYAGAGWRGPVSAHRCNDRRCLASNRHFDLGSRKDDWDPNLLVMESESFDVS